MTIIVRNMQRMVKINLPQLKQDVNVVISCAGYYGYGVGVMLLADKGVKKLNKQYRGINEVTDVLAFPYHEILPENAGLLPEVHPEERILGDIVLGVPYIAADCLKRGENLQATLVTMFTHGLCHLVGFDHESQEEWMQMHNREFDILEKCNKLTGYKCKPLLGIGHYGVT